MPYVHTHVHARSSTLTQTGTPPTSAHSSGWGIDLVKVATQPLAQYTVWDRGKHSQTLAQNVSGNRVGINRYSNIFFAPKLCYSSKLTYLAINRKKNIADILAVKPANWLNVMACTCKDPRSSSCGCIHLLSANEVAIASLISLNRLHIALSHLESDTFTERIVNKKRSNHFNCLWWHHCCSVSVQRGGIRGLSLCNVVVGRYRDESSRYRKTSNMFYDTRG